MENNIQYKEQQAELNKIASELGVVVYRPDYHGKARDKNTVLFYTEGDDAHNRMVDLEPHSYTRAEAHDCMKYQKVKIPEKFVWRDPFWSFENTNVNGVLSYEFANFGRLDLRSIRWKEVLKGDIQLALAKREKFCYLQTIGGAGMLHEADETYNEFNREVIRAMALRDGQTYLGSINYYGEVRERILTKEQSIYEKYTGGEIYNFSCAFCVPVADEQLEELIRTWNESAPAYLVNKIMNRVEAIGGVNFLWT